MIEPSTTFNAGGKPNRKPVEKPADVLALFAAEDRRIAIWGRPYTGPVKNTKHREERQINGDQKH